MNYDGDDDDDDDNNESKQMMRTTQKMHNTPNELNKKQQHGQHTNANKNTIILFESRARVCKYVTQSNKKQFV